MEDAPSLHSAAIAGRVPQLDGVRGLAILLVMLHHFAVFEPACAVDQVVKSATMSMWIGVDLFFLLSGYLITGILLDTRHRHNYFTSFYARRVLRIFPLFYAVTFFSLVLLPMIPNPKSADFGALSGREWWYWTYLQNYAIAAAGKFQHGIMDVTWSLAIEEQFYVVWPLIVLLLPSKRLVQLCVAMIAGALALRVALAALHVGAIVGYVITPTRVDSLAYGALIALLVRGSFNTEKLRRAAKIVGIIGLAGVALLFSVEHKIWWQASLG
jgi:peptidoglycan/LPS O-acetylase OafA/YrhL